MFHVEHGRETELEEEERKKALDAIEALLKKIDACVSCESEDTGIALTTFDLCFIKHCIVEHIKIYDPMMFEGG